ncbi:glycoside hydrolase family 65 protein [Sesbania bispinosa]|nr:glycoside hydrolase family 65 protein [Sesbania bispinosa]
MSNLNCDSKKQQDIAKQVTSGKPYDWTMVAKKLGIDDNIVQAWNGITDSLIYYHSTNANLYYVQKSGVTNAPPQFTSMPSHNHISVQKSLADLVESHNRVIKKMHNANVKPSAQLVEANKKLKVLLETAKQATSGGSINWNDVVNTFGVHLDLAKEASGINLH